MTLGERIKEIRKDNNLTQQEFAEKISVSRPFISRIEANKEKPSESLIKLIAATFGIELDWIVHGNGYKESRIKTINKILQNVDSLALEELNKFDFAECSSLLVHILSANTKENSDQYYKKNIHSILNALNCLFYHETISEYTEDEIEITTAYIEKKVKEAVDAFKKENMNEELL